jgi:virginiamycin A acetyltransferase
MLLKILIKCYHFFAFLAALPFLLTARFTKYVHVSELVSLLPFKFGEHVRYYFYKNSLAQCGVNVVINFGTILSYNDITIGNNVSIGPYNTIGHIDIGDYTLTAQYCNFLSGGRLHDFKKLDVPIMQQPGNPERIKVGPDIWVGANVTVMANVGHGCVIGAGSVVTKDIPPYSVIAGNPACIIRTRN